MTLPKILLQLSDPLRGAGPPRRVVRATFLSIVLVGFTFLYFFVATQLVHQTNQNRQKSDQQNNIEHTRIAIGHLHPEIAQTGFANALWQWFPHYTDGVVNPLWPWLSSRFQEDDNPSDEQIFLRGKWLNVSLTALFCIACGLYLARSFSLLAALNGMIIIGFGALLPRAVFYQPEPLYFILFTLCWLGALYALHRNPVWIYAVLGVLTGLAYLAKTSIQPLMLSFILVSCYRFLQDVACAAIARGKGQRDCTGWHWQRHVVGLFFFAILFLLTAGPRLNYAHERFGSAFHSYPSSWMWMDDFPEGVVFMREHPDKASLEQLTEEDRPSLGNYLKEHPPEAFRARLVDGFWWTFDNLLVPPKAKNADQGKEPEPWRSLLPARGLYLLGLVAIVGILLLWHLIQRPKPLNAAQRLSPEASTTALFVVGCTLFYALAYGWYVPVGKGDRFLLSLYTPLVLTLLWSGEAILRRIQLRGPGRAYAWCTYQTAHLALFAFLVFRLVELYRWPVFYEK